MGALLIDLGLIGRSGVVVVRGIQWSARTLRAAIDALLDVVIAL